MTNDIQDTMPDDKELSEILKQSFSETVTIREISEGEKMKHHPYWIYVNGNLYCFEFNFSNAKQALLAWRERYAEEKVKTVDRFEVIDESGRAYVRGSIYGLPVSVKLSFQDNDRTLKVFVEAAKEGETER